MNHSAAPILYIGAILKDTVCLVDRLPLAGEGIVVNKRTERVGGCAYNMATISQYMGAPYELFVPLGEGSCADFLSTELAKANMAGVKIDGATFDNGDCLCLITPDGERTMITTPGIERHFKSSWLTALDGRNFAFTVANGYEIMGSGGPSIIDFAKRQNATFVFGPGPLTCLMPDEMVDSINEMHPIWHLNEDEVMVLTHESTIPDAVAALYSKSQNVVIVTAGPDGTYYTTDGTVHHMKTTPIEPVDTIGAGDSHLGAVLSARTLGYGWEESIAIAQQVSSCICLTEGAICPVDVFPQQFLHMPFCEGTVADCSLSADGSICE